MPDFDGLYCDDESIAQLPQADWPAVVPGNGVLARGIDGAFSAGDRWGLASASVGDWSARGIGPGHVLIIAKGTAITEKGNRKDVLAVESAVTTKLTLRRLGLESGEGEPPSPIGGAAGVQFSCITARPQIAEATRLLNQRFRIDTAGELESPADFRRACALWVLCDLYTFAWKATPDGPAHDVFYERLQGLCKLRDEALAVLARTYGTGPASRRPAVGRMVDDPAWRLPRAF